MRPALLVLALLGAVAAAPSAAQEPDTTDWHHYLPLAIGNEWQYRYLWNSPPPYEHAAFRVVGDSLVDGTPYFTVERCTRLTSPVPTCDEQPHLIRYEEEAAIVVERLAVGGEQRLEMWPPAADGFVDYCRLDLPFGELQGAGPECFDGSQPWLGVGGEYGVSVRIGGDQTPSGTRKAFGTGFGGTVVFSGIGLLESLFEFSGPEIVFARVDGVEYGIPAIVVGTEETAPPEVPALTVFPNPLRSEATLRFALDAPERLTLAVYDMRGQLVRADALGATSAGGHDLRFDAGDLPPGARRLRLAGDGGFEAVRGVIVLR